MQGQEVLAAEVEIKAIKQEQQLMHEKPETVDPVEQEVQKAENQEQIKALEQERFAAEEAMIGLEQRKANPSTEDKISQMVKQQQKHATGEDRKESAEYLVAEARGMENHAQEKLKKEQAQVEEFLAQLKKGQPLRTKVDHVPSLQELAKRKK